GGHELPKDRAETVAELLEPLAEELRQRLARVRQHLAVRDVGGALHREDEAFGRRLAPFPKALRLLQAVIGAVYLDRAELPAGPLELALLDEPFGIEVALAPGRIDPAADAGADHGCASYHAGTDPGRARFTRRTAAKEPGMA